MRSHHAERDDQGARGASLTSEGGKRMRMLRSEGMRSRHAECIACGFAEKVLK